MTIKYFRASLAAAAVTLASLALGGCGDGYEGDTYADADGGVSVQFKDDNRAYVTMGPLGSREVGYKVDDDKVILEGPGGDNMVLTRKDDGSLDGGLLFGNLKKK